MNKAIVRKLKDILGDENVLDGKADILCHSYDSSPFREYPSLVLYVKKSDEIKKIVEICNNERIPLYSRGSGTGTTGASIPLKHGIMMVFTRMNKILEINEEDLTIDVEPGVITGDIHKFLEKKGFFYPPDPSSLRTCTIGGNVMTNAGGPRGVKYGVTRDYVISLEIVSGKGEIIVTSPKTKKNSTGYNLTQLIVGSEGTLGLVTKITLRFIPKPKKTLTIMAEFPSVYHAMSGILNVFKCGILPSCMEYLDSNCLNLIKNTNNLQHTLLIGEIDGFECDVDHQLTLMEEAFKKANSLHIEIAKDNEKREEIWNLRRGLSAKIKKLGFSGKISEDICVPRHLLPQITEKITSISKKYDTMILVFGHAGDGNLHINFLFDKSSKDKVHNVNLAIEELMNETIKIGGVISGEHGIGLSKKDFFKSAVGETNYKLMKEIKKIFDPNNILNPGKVFDV